MPNFGARSREQLETLDPRLQLVMNEGIQYVDFSILEGHRGQAKQTEYFRTGRSKVQWPNGKHNALPSLAVDVAPYPIRWDDALAFARLAGFLEAIAVAHQIRTRWGGDWNMNWDSTDQSFMDLVHLELID